MSACMKHAVCTNINLTYQSEEFQGEIFVRHRRVREDQGELFHLPHGGRIVGQFSGRAGWSGAGAAGSVAMRAHRSTPSPLTKSAVSAAAAAAATAVAGSSAAGPIFLSTMVLVTHRIMIAQSRLLLARGLQPERPTKNLIQPGQMRYATGFEISVVRNREK